MKKTRKILSFVTALAISASAFASLAVTASAAFDGSITADGTRVTINSPKAAVAIVATYEGEKLTKVAATDVNEGETIIDVAGGDRIMLWDSLEGMTPLAEAVTAGDGAEVTPVPTQPAEEATPVPTAPAGDDNAIFAGDTVEKEWKFDLGASDQAAEEGWTAVAPDKDYLVDDDYGFVGINENSYKVGNRYDGFGNQKGQVIQLASGGGSGISDAIGSVGEDTYGNAGDIYYPTRFALKAEDEAYYRVRVTVTTLDPSKDAEISLYTERKHPIFTDTVVKAGETKTVSFSVRPTPIYYEKSEPKGAIADNMVNVAACGENSAIATIEIQKVQEYPVFWVLGDSTVTDGNCDLPFFRLQNYTGVGTGLTKYLPRNMAMVNEGEGGLNAADNYHYNMVASRIKAGDYMYVEYGHNHKNDGPTGYVSNLDKYYNKCHEVGAKLLIVSPIIQLTTVENGEWKATLTGFRDAGKEYVEQKIAAGADDIAFVDLNTYCVAFHNRVTKEQGNGDTNVAKFYHQTPKGGGTDASHPNDAGSENLAYEFMNAAEAVKAGDDAVQAAVVEGFLKDRTDETPNLIKESIIAGGLGGEAWPTYIVPTDNEYPVVIQDITVGEDGSVTSAKVKVQDAKVKLTTYGIIVITVTGEDGTEKGKIYAVDQVDNSTGYGVQTIKSFTNDVKIGETDKYSAVVLKAVVDSSDKLAVDESDPLEYSAVYTPTEIAKHLITDEDGNGGEDFEFFGAKYEGDDASSISGFNKWTRAGSAGATLTLGDAGDYKYVNVVTDGIKGGVANNGSFYLWKEFVTDEETGKATDIGSSGKYMISADIKYVSGGGMNATFSTGNSSSAPWGTQTIKAFTIGNNGTITVGDQEAGQISALEFTNVVYELDMDNAKASVSVNGGTPVEVDVANYNKLVTPVSPSNLTHFMFDANRTAAAIQVANLKVAKLRTEKLPTKTLTVAPDDAVKGTVSIAVDSAPVSGSTYTAAKNTIATISAAPLAGYEFEKWIDASGETFSYAADTEVRMFDDMSLMAVFKVEVVDPINYAYKETFSTLATDTLSKNGWAGPNLSPTIASDADHGNYLNFAVGTNNDRNVKGTFPSVANLEVDAVVSFDMAITPGNNHATDFVVFDSGATIGNNAQVASGYLLKLYNGAANSTTYTINGGSNTATIPSGVWVNVLIRTHMDTKKVDIKNANGETEIYSGTEDMNGTGIPAGINFLGGRYQSVFKLDNVKVYTADQLAQ